MDPYIDAGKLDPGHPLHAAKIDNLRRGDRAHRDLCEEVDALPVKLTLQTTDTCNLDCPHCQIPRAEKIPRMEAAAFEPQMDQHGVLLDRTTNGTLLHGDRIEWIARVARDVKVSFDGASPATFERLRRGARFAAVCANVRALLARLAEAGRGAMVSLQMTLMRSVPYDRENFLSAAFRAAQPVQLRSVTRWSGRMRQFDLTARRSTR